MWRRRPLAVSILHVGFCGGRSADKRKGRQVLREQTRKSSFKGEVGVHQDKVGVGREVDGRCSGQKDSRYRGGMSLLGPRTERRLPVAGGRREGAAGMRGNCRGRP